MRSARKVALAFLVFALGLGFVSIASPTARAATTSISLFGSATSGWGTTRATESNPGPTLTVSQGDAVTITLHSTDGAQHEFFIDYNGNGVLDSGEPVSATFGTTTTLNFTATQAGTFTYYCLIHPTIMKGTFVVQATSTGGTNGLPATTLLVIGLVVVVVAVAGIVVLIMRRRPKAP